ncbi:hypothetical protein ElyMa_004334500 [Elysia marginata]|uniref:B-box C-terminal domain-containing protein n=1 Tax=Elysia marginata TaxID=1093978 RepID=A0AAV4H2B7_9GAST|nr:hypothetical protein ElyMa_004334500 [Elysia marginata]
MDSSCHASKDVLEKDAMLESLEAEHIRKLLQFTQKVKDCMRTKENGTAIFGKAVQFLTHPLPNVLDNQATSSRPTPSAELPSSTASRIPPALPLVPPRRTEISPAASTTRAQIPRIFREITRFSVSCPGDEREPRILDLKVLPDDLVVMADYGNACLKLFTKQGKHISSMKLDGRPRHLAVMHPAYSRTGVNVAVTLPEDNTILVVQLTASGLRQEVSGEDHATIEICEKQQAVHIQPSNGNKCSNCDTVRKTTA